MGAEGTRKEIQIWNLCGQGEGGGSWTSENLEMCVRFVLYLFFCVFFLLVH